MKINLNALSILGYVILVAAAVGLIARRSFLAVGFVFVFIQVLAALLMLWARFSFGLRSFHFSAEATEGGLITSGPYKYIRHPIYAAVIYFVTASVLSYISPVNILLWAVCCAGAGIRIYSEEILLKKKYPEYIEYARRTKRIVPFLI